MSSLTLLGDISGSVVLDAPPISGSNTITLPTTGGTMRTTRTPGAILQVVQAGSNGTSTSSTSFVDSGLTASITPTSSTNKILVTVNGVCRATNQRGGFALVRNSTQLFLHPES